MDNPIPAEVLAFIDSAIESVDQLEILLLLRRHQGRTWTAQAVSDEMRGQPSAARARLKLLENAGLVEVSPGEPATYRYRPVDGEADRLVARLEEAFRSFRPRVIERVFKKPESARS